MDDMVFAMTLAPWPIVLYHGTDRDEVEMKGLERLAAMGFRKPKPYFAGTVDELEEQIGAVANAVIRTYMFGRFQSSQIANVRASHQHMPASGTGTTLDVTIMKTLSDIAEGLLDEFGMDQETQLMDGKTERASQLLHRVHDVLGVPGPNEWVCTYISHALTHMLVLEDETPDEVWPGGNLESEEELLQWLTEYPRAIETIDRARQEFGCCDSFMKDVTMGLELMSKIIFDTVYHFLLDLVRTE